MAGQDLTRRPPPPRPAPRRGAAFVLILAVLLAVPSCARRDPPIANDRVTVNIAGRTFHLELAVDDQARYQGLSDRAYIAADGGMLFVFPYPRDAAFVMRRCLTPIDIIFLDPGGRIDSWHQMQVEPYDRPDHLLTLYRSRWPVLFAIEIAGGVTGQLALKEGQKIDLPIEELKRLAR